MSLRLAWLSGHTGWVWNEAVKMHSIHFCMVESTRESVSRPAAELEWELFEPHRIFNAARPVIEQRAGENRTVPTALGKQLQKVPRRERSSTRMIEVAMVRAKEKSAPLRIGHGFSHFGACRSTSSFYFQATFTPVEAQGVRNQIAVFVPRRQCRPRTAADPAPRLRPIRQR
jgi:hypothetical protein